MLSWVGYFEVLRWSLGYKELIRNQHLYREVNEKMRGALGWGHGVYINTFLCLFCEEAVFMVLFVFYFICLQWSLIHFTWFFYLKSRSKKYW